jgi:hypothetical protein
MKTKREEKLEKELKSARQALHKEKQKNKDLQMSREKHKLKSKQLSQKLSTEALKKNEVLPITLSNLLKDMVIAI